MTIAPCLSRGKDDWETPAEVFEPLHREFGLEVDVCATKENTKCSDYISAEMDGLTYRWHQMLNNRDKPVRAVWMNPPYSQWQKWVCKAELERQKGVLVVALLPSRTDTKAFHEVLWNNCSVELRFVRGRITFVGAPNPAPFPSLVAIFHPDEPCRWEDCQNMVKWGHSRGNGYCDDCEFTWGSDY